MRRVSFLRDNTNYVWVNFVESFNKVSDHGQPGDMVEGFGGLR